VQDIDSNKKVISESYGAAATEHLKTNRCSFLLTDGAKWNLETWTVGTWSMKMRRNQIVDHGNVSDKLNHLTSKNQEPHRQKRNFTTVSDM
jgi:hypothetical protein